MMRRSLRLGILLGLCLPPHGWAVADEQPFSVLHLTDVHISPHLAKDPPSVQVRGQDTIDWLIAEVAKPQTITEWAAAAPAPDFAIVTGDITEYGVIDDTWDIVERTFDKLPFPWYAVPGNHDNTWVAMYDVMRRRHGGENHALDHKGCHFVFLCSASPQEPVPSIDATTRAWLADDLAQVDANIPVFVALHHPPEIDEFANPAELVTLIDMLRDHNVQLLLFGHGHSVRLHDAEGIPGVQGGSTFGGNSGYGVLTVGDGRVRYAYRYLKKKVPGGTDDPPGGWQTVYDAPLVQRRRVFDLKTPTPYATVAGPTMRVRVIPAEEAREQPARMSFAIDDQPAAGERDVQLSEPLDIDVPIADLAPGAHLLTVRLHLTRESDHRSDLRTRVFYVEDPQLDIVWRRRFRAAMKAAPRIVGDLLVVPRTDGVLLAVERKTGAERWRLATGGEILATPAATQDTIVLGSGDGYIYGANLSGTIRWKHHTGFPVYGQPIIADDTVYIGDNGGNMHALSVADGALRWTFARADYAIECQPAIWDDLLAFGAWDGMLYALDRATGALRWKTAGPKSSSGKAARYYAPADCGPVVVGDRLMVCDRGYHLGAFARNGALLSNEPLEVSAIAASADSANLYTRHRDDRVRKMDTSGTTLWEAQVPAGRFPIPPTVYAGCVYVCANTGLLTALDARTGKKLWSYRTTPGFYVMASVAVSDDGVCYVVGMDGSLTAIRPRRQLRG